MLELSALTYFVEVYETKNMTLASERLFVTRQAISKSLRQLETMFGVPLLIAHHSGVSFTAQGDCLYQHAKRLLAELNSLNAAMQDMSLHSSRTLRLGFGRMTYNVYIDAISQFQALHPQIEVQAQAYPPAELFALLSERKLDAGISTTHCSVDGILERILVPRPLYVLMCSDDALAKYNELSIEDIQDRTAYFPPEVPMFFDEFSDYVQHERLKISCCRCPQSDIIMVLQHIRKTHGLFLTSGNFSRFFNLQEGFVMRKLNNSRQTPMPDKSIRVLTPENAHNQQNIKLFVDYLLSLQSPSS